MLLTVPSALHARAPAPVARIIKLIAADNDFVEAAKKVAGSRFAARRAIDRGSRPRVWAA